MSWLEYETLGTSKTEFDKVVYDNVLAQRTAEAAEILASQDRGFAVEQPWPWKEDAQLLGGPGNLVELDGDVGADIFYEVHLFCLRHTLVSWMMAL